MFVSPCPQPAGGCAAKIINSFCWPFQLIYHVYVLVIIERIFATDTDKLLTYQKLCIERKF